MLDLLPAYFEMLGERPDPNAPAPPFDEWVATRSLERLSPEDYALAADELEMRAQHYGDEVVLVSPAHRASWCQERARNLQRIAALLRRHARREKDEAR